jgi:hypothetical protein
MVTEIPSLNMSLDAGSNPAIRANMTSDLT